MNINEYKNKYGSKDVSNYKIYQNNGTLISILNTVKSDELQVTKNGRYFLRITDALIDKTFLDYITKNPKLEGYIKAETLFRGLDGYDSKINIDMPKVKLSNFKFKNICGETANINFLFELFIDSYKGYAVEYKISE